MASFKKMGQIKMGPIAQILNLSDLYDVSIGQRALSCQLGSDDQVWMKFEVRVGPIAQNLKLSDSGGPDRSKFKIKRFGWARSLKI